MFVDSVFRYHILLVHFLCLSYAFLLSIHLQENKRKAMQINVYELQGLIKKGGGDRSSLLSSVIIQNSWCAQVLTAGRKIWATFHSCNKTLWSKETCERVYLADGSRGRVSKGREKCNKQLEQEVEWPQCQHKHKAERAERRWGKLGVLKDTPSDVLPPASPQ